jgi:hypothetical protein
MKTRRTLLRIALLGYALAAAATTAPPRASAAGLCGPGGWSCNTASQCAVYCGSAVPLPLCSAHCCVCPPPPRD